jgi:enamine deaminase RidA (YjgF/YER057c/UK114 family)
MWFSNRRKFLGGSTLFTAGVAAYWLKSISPTAFAGQADRGTAGAEARIRQLGLELQKATKPPAPFEPAVLVDNMLYLSGHGPRKPEGGFVTGKVGTSLTLEEGQAAARLTGLDMLSTMRDALGSLDKVVRLVKVTGMVNSGQGFTKHPQVINGFSELMIDVFGEQAGKGARSAVGMSGLPFDIAVEIEAIFQVQG